MSWEQFCAGASVIISAITLIVAVWAILRWKKQDELKARLSFKSAVGDYAAILHRMPDCLFGSDKIRSKRDIQELHQRFKLCQMKWLVSEGLMDGNEVVTKAWKALQKTHLDYVFKGDVPRIDVEFCCLLILEAKFVFK